MRSITRENSLRLALLTSLGLVPLACGGTTLREQDEPSGGSANEGGSSAQSGSSQGGSASQAGSHAKGGSGNVAGSASHGGAPSACTSPQTDPITGLVSCAEGYTHRPTAKQCQTVPPGGVPPVPSPLPRADGSVQCGPNTGETCAAYRFGYCRMFAGGGPSLPSCQSGCVNDSDCGMSEACLCGDPESPTGGSCRYVACLTDADCSGGNLCASASQVCGYGTFACLTAQDECASSADCGGGLPCYYDVSADGSPRRQCGTNVVCGRPFLVEQTPRLAAVIAGGAWSASTDESSRPQLEGLAADERAALAEHWSYLGQMEHASIAAFARFSLQLLALGAPPELVTACTQALADETAHTQLCFQIASAYAGRALGPGPLDVQRSLEESSLESVVELVLAEGCFGETRAALEALEAAENAQDPYLRATYARIAADEERHAELAFRFVRWALERGGNQVRARIEAAVAAATADRASQQISVPCLAGLLSEASSSALDATAVVRTPHATAT